MKNFELFGRKVDFLIVPVLTAGVIYLFYGGAAAILTVAWIAVVAHLKPLQRFGYTREQLAIIGSAIALSFSIFLRSIFFDEYCATAPWAVNAEVQDLFQVQMPCFVRGGYLQYVTEGSWRSVLRDVVMPLAGVALLFHGLKKGTTRRNGVLAAGFVLVLGLWINAPLLNRQSEVRAQEQPKGSVVLTAVEPVWIQVYDRGRGGTLFQGELAAGQSYTVPATAAAPLLRAGKPEALRIRVDGVEAPAIGAAGRVASEVSLLPSDLLRVRQ